LSDDKRHKKLCLKAREKAVACFDIEKIARQYAELYRKALGLKLKAQS
jgi:glycosyltransferase involved in cell wall biosynthesis